MSKAILYQGQPSATAAAIYTATVLTSIDAVSVCNTTAGALTLNVWIVPGGGTAAADNMIYNAVSVGANAQISLSLLVNQALGVADELHMQASAATSLTVTISGRIP